MPVALITGASRGIGRAAAVALADQGFDLAITARTIHEGGGRDDGDVAVGTRVIEGSLESTAALLEQAGGRVLPVACDLLDRAAVENLVETVLGTWGQIDVLVNNAVYHRGNNVLLTELTPELIEENLLANAVHPLVLITRVLPEMLRVGRGRIINVVSGVGENDPPKPALQGGWGVLYGMSKAALTRIAGVVAVEAGDRNVLCFGLDPGFIKTAVVGALPVFNQAPGISEQIPAEAIAWLASSADAAALNGQTLIAQELVTQHGLLRA
jgi:NAD(P)-dependent dehydrogenase (short-subunit alcohol dehydrogenase family)